ncbi:MAG: hypothetical protein ACI910_001640 [Oleispira sp.]|jgi:hypothetical protein
MTHLMPTDVKGHLMVMNTKIYKHVYTLAGCLMDAVDRDDQAQFDDDYAELKQICDDNEGSSKDHPVQWETLADFTGDIALSISLYEKALAKAEAISSTEFCSSIGFSTASMKLELDDKVGAIESLERARLACLEIEDKELKREIHDLLTELKSVD